MLLATIIGNLSVVAFLLIGSLRTFELSRLSTYNLYTAAAESGKATACSNEAAALKEQSLLSADQATNNQEVAADERARASELEEQANAENAEAGEAEEEMVASHLRESQAVDAAAVDAAEAGIEESVATSAAAESATEVAEAETAEVADAAISWLPVIDVIGQLLADALFAASAIEAGVAWGAQAAADTKVAAVAEETAAADAAALEAAHFQELEAEDLEAAAADLMTAKDLEADAAARDGLAEDEEAQAEEEQDAAKAAEEESERHARQSQKALREGASHWIDAFLVYIWTLVCLSWWTINKSFRLLYKFYRWIAVSAEEEGADSASPHNTEWNICPIICSKEAVQRACYGGGAGLVVAFCTRHRLISLTLRHGEFEWMLLYTLGLTLMGSLIGICVSWSYVYKVFTTCMSSLRTCIRNQWEGLIHFNDRMWQWEEYYGVAACLTAAATEFIFLLFIGFHAVRQWCKLSVFMKAVQWGMELLHLSFTSPLAIFAQSKEAALWCSLLVATIIVLGLSVLFVVKPVLAASKQLFSLNDVRQIRRQRKGSVCVPLVVHILMIVSSMLLMVSNWTQSVTLVAEAVNSLKVQNANVFSIIPTLRDTLLVASATAVRSIFWSSARVGCCCGVVAITMVLAATADAKYTLWCQPIRRRRYIPLTIQGDAASHQLFLYASITGAFIGTCWRTAVFWFIFGCGSLLFCRSLLAVAQPLMTLSLRCELLALLLFLCCVCFTYKFPESVLPKHRDVAISTALKQESLAVNYSSIEHKFISSIELHSKLYQTA